MAFLGLQAARSGFAEFLTGLGATGASAWVARNAAAPTLEPTVPTPAIPSASVSPADRAVLYQRSLALYRDPWESVKPAARTIRHLHPFLLMSGAQGATVLRRPGFVDLTKAVFVVDRAQPSRSLSLADINATFEVKTRFTAPGVVRFDTVASDLANAARIQQAVDAGDDAALVAASTVVYEKQKAARTELVSVPGLVVVNDLMDPAQLAGLQAAVQNPTMNPLNLLGYARVISGMSASAQVKLVGVLTDAGLTPQSVYSSEDLVASMSDLVVAARRAGVEPALIAELESRLSRLSSLHGSVPRSDLSAAFTLSYFQVRDDALARISAGASPAEKIRIEKQLALVNALGLLALQAYMSPMANRDVAHLILRNFVGLNEQVDREPNADARLVGTGVGSGRSVAPAGSTSQAGDDGQSGGGQSGLN